LADRQNGEIRTKSETEQDGIKLKLLIREP
jgi:hypothetical protein